jgi:manganese oxidase
MRWTSLLLLALVGCQPAPQLPPPAEDELEATPVETRTPSTLIPDGWKLPYRLEDGVKVFHLVAEPVTMQFAPGLEVYGWGYNGSSPGPVIEAIEGDRVRIHVTNHLPEPTTVHWHGLRVPNRQDGVEGLTQKGINPGETWTYEFTLNQTGTYMYHPHADSMVQIAMGAMGFFIIHPKDPEPIDQDFALFLAEWAIPPGATTPDPLVMLDFNYFTMNGKLPVGSTPLTVKKGDRVRIRFGNISMDNHPMHLHGFTFNITGTSGGRIPQSAWIPSSTVDVVVGDTRDIEFVADQEGLWALHCHKTHHTMGGMVHNLPNMLGVDQGELAAEIAEMIPGYHPMMESGMSHMMQMEPAVPHLIANGLPGPYGWIDMGGMFTILQVVASDDPDRQGDPQNQQQNTDQELYGSEGDFSHHL